MKKILVIFLILFLVKCGSERRTIEITSKSLDEELNDFLTHLLQEPFQLRKVVTVFIDTNGKHYQVSFKNKEPHSCEGVVGSLKSKNEFVIYFIVRYDHSSLVRWTGEYDCQLESETEPPSAIPLAIDARERFYKLEGDSLVIIGAGDQPR